MNSRGFSCDSSRIRMYRSASSCRSPIAATTVTRGGKTTATNADAITSRGLKHDTPQDLADFVRGHWAIKYRLHDVRDATLDKHRRRA